ncbi:MAG TPA: NTP transferase domain-containing protein, partial [Stellaceae bacterium]|nr:NTP transferase domain-containing protein [Stellaceae bacterium]
MPSRRVNVPDSAIVLAAGRGKRMGALTDRLPKPLIPVEGRALIDHVLDR